MPAMDGRELLLRARQLYPEIPCIFVTAYAELESVREAARANGVVKLLTKPWDKEALMEGLAQCASLSNTQGTGKRLHSRTQTPDDSYTSRKRQF